MYDGIFPPNLILLAQKMDEYCYILKEVDRNKYQFKTDNGKTNDSLLTIYEFKYFLGVKLYIDQPVLTIKIFCCF